MPISLRESILQSHRLPFDEDVIIQRAEMLSPSDQALVEAVLVRGQSASAVSRLMQAPAAAVRRRVLRLARRLASRKFLHAMRALPHLPEEDVKLAQLRYCRGYSHGRMCAELGLTSHALRRRLCALEARIETIHHLSSAQRRQAVGL